MTTASALHNDLARMGVAEVRRRQAAWAARGPAPVASADERLAAALALIHAGDVTRLLAHARRLGHNDMDWVATVTEAYERASR